MTERKITIALKKIETCKRAGYHLEALIRIYHLNGDLIRYMLSGTASGYPSKDKKIKHIVNEFLEQVTENPELKSIISKRNLKVLKPWLSKMDRLFRRLKVEQPADIKGLLLESEKILGILNIFAKKLLFKKRA